LEHAPFASGDESDIEEDEPDEPSHVSNNSMSHFSDENNAILAAAAISEWSEPASEAESTKAQAEANAADPHQLKRSSGYVACYCDDLIIVSDSAEAHKKHILELFRIYLTRKFICSPQKVKCFANTCVILEWWWEIIVCLRIPRRSAQLLICQNPRILRPRFAVF
jgi:hypothetical protein